MARRPTETGVRAVDSTRLRRLYAVAFQGGRTFFRYP
jgi:hypothetical protein